MKLTYKKVKPTNPTKARKSIVPTDQHTQTTLHAPPTRAPVGQTQNNTANKDCTTCPTPQTSAHKTRPRQTSAGSNATKKPLQMRTPRPTTACTSPPHSPTHPKTPRARNLLPSQAAPTLLSHPLGEGEPRAVYAHSSRWQSHLQQGRARHGTLESLAQALPAPLLVLQAARVCGVPTEITLQTDRGKANPDKIVRSARQRSLIGARLPIPLASAQVHFSVPRG